MKTFNGVAIPQSLEDLADPARTALLVYDMQVGIASQLRNGAEVIAAVAEALETARAAGMRVAYCRHLSAPTAWMGAFQARMGMAWQRRSEPSDVKPWFLRDSAAFGIVPELAPRPEDFVFDKLGMSAFEGTPLQFLLRDCGLSGLAIVGTATEIGIEPTVRHAADLGVFPILIEDALGAGEEAAGDRALASLRFMGDALFTTKAAFRTALER